MLKKLLCAVLTPLTYCYNFDLCVVGATSGLGNELIYRCIKDAKKKVLALSYSKNSKICVPYRKNTFNYANTEEFKNDDLLIESYWSHIPYTYDNIVFCTGAKPFQDDYSDILMEKFLNNLPENCKNVALVSAYGVGDSIENANLGIQVMDSLYLKDVYRAKNYQEKALNNYQGDVNKLIYRPKALSYGKTLLDSTSRFELAGKIISDLNL